MSPSSNPSVSERVIVCQRGDDLAEFVPLLASLGVEVEVHDGPLPTTAQVAGAALLILAGQRLAEGKSAGLQSWPRTLAVVDVGNRTLNAHLARLGVSLIVRRPIHPRALRLLILHALYRGPERRNKRRVMIGQPIRAGAGLFKQNATLLELSRTGARIEVATAPKIGTLIQLVIGKELTGGKPIKLQAKVVRSIRAAEPGDRVGSEIGVALVDPNGETGRVLQTILDRHSNGAAPVPTANRSAVASAPPRSASTPSATIPSPNTPLSSNKPPSTAAKPRTTPAPARPFAAASLQALARAVAAASADASTPSPGASASRGGSSASASSSARSGTAATSSVAALATTPEARRLPPSHVPEAPAPSARTEIEAVTLDPATMQGDALDSDFDAGLDRLDGDASSTELGSDFDFELDADGDADVEDGSDFDLGLGLEIELDEEITPSEALDAGSNDVGPGTERRGAARVAYTQRVVALDDQAARVVVGRDLSHGGMRIDPNPELVVGDVVKLALHAGSETEPLVVLAGVERDDGENGMLLAFATLTSPQRARLEKILAATSSILSADPLDAGLSGGSIVMGEVLRRVSRGAQGGTATSSAAD